MNTTLFPSLMPILTAHLRLFRCTFSAKICCLRQRSVQLAIFRETINPLLLVKVLHAER